MRWSHVSPVVAGAGLTAFGAGLALLGDGLLDGAKDTARNAGTTVNAAVTSR
jgi:hypothetical protein